MTMMTASIKNKKNECEQMVVWRMREETNQKCDYDDKVMIPGRSKAKTSYRITPPASHAQHLDNTRTQSSIWH